MTTLLYTCVRGYWAEYLLILCRGPTPITPLICGTVVLCAPYNVGVVDSFVYNTI
jgi:hypothetical protein